ncbi:MAG: glycoside hydrolase family 2 [Clostridiales bacterium]|jgi:beta-galactosidase/beta-glucuronidase|nr:glycoside hydrolase family 2 [Clostridiales bacterium]
MSEKKETASAVRKELFTAWGERLKGLPDEIPLSEYPRPQFERGSFFNLNGRWDYAILKKNESFFAPQGKILVPFSPESPLSGVGRRLTPDEKLHYRREFELDCGFVKSSVFLHFGAVDQSCVVTVNGACAGTHTGGFLPFSLDVSEYVRAGGNEIAVEVEDCTDAGYFSRGKQSSKPGGIFYSPQSGIWQTVWLESLPKTYLSSVKMTPDIDRGVLSVEPFVCGGADSDTVRAVVFDGERIVTEAELIPNRENSISIPDFELWSPESPRLYGIRFTVGEDVVRSYFGMRKFAVSRDGEGIIRMTLNNKPYFHNGLLDQGYWPDGLLTPPSDEAMLNDIRTVKNLGFNMLRKHIKIEPLRWYYHCDREGVLVWQDMVNGGEKMNIHITGILPFLGVHINDGEKNYKKFGRQNAEGRKNYYAETEKTVGHLYNSVCIAVWVPFNEGWGQFDALKAVDFIRERDKSRLVDHASGWHDQGGGDLKSLHVYFKPVKIRRDKKGARPVALSEFGGYSYGVPEHVQNPARAFGYKIFKTEAALNDAYGELYRRRIVPALKDGLCACVYTQVSDVEDEINGLMTYDRAVCKLNAKTVREINALLKL